MLHGSWYPDPQTLGSSRTLHIPFALERLKVAERARNCLIGEVRLVLLQKAAACLGVVGFRYRVFQIALLECVYGDNYAIDLGERVVQIAFGARRR